VLLRIGGVAVLQVHDEVVVEARREGRVAAQAPVVDARVGLIVDQAQRVRLQGHDAGPAAVRADRAVEMTIVVGLVALVGLDGDGLEREQVEPGDAVLRSVEQPEALEIVGGVAPGVAAQQAAIEIFEGDASVLQANRLALSVEIAAVEFCIGLQHVVLVDVARVVGHVAVHEARILQFEPQAQRIDQPFDADEHARTQQQRIVRQRVVAIVVMPRLVAHSIVRAEQQPVEIAQSRDAGLVRMPHVARRLGFGARAVGARFDDERSGRVRGLRTCIGAEAQDAAEQRAGDAGA
jgi:hypothetical protein